MLDTAIQHVQSGRNQEAIALLERAVHEAEASSGAGSFAHVKALSDLGSILSFLGEDARAAEVFEAATEKPRSDVEEEKHRLTALLNLAEVLERQGRLVDAEDAVRRSLQARRELYGPSHPGYAFGLEPLGHVLLARGKLDAAHEAAAEAVANFRHHQHPRLTSALALLAEVDAALGAPPFAFAPDLDDAALRDVATRVSERAPEADPNHARPLLLALAETLEARFGLADKATLEALTLLANLEAAGGDPALREQALERLCAGQEACGNARAAFEAAIGLALVSVERGDRAEAEERFARARVRADALGKDAQALLAQAESYLSRIEPPAPLDPALVHKAASALEARVRDRVAKDLVAHLHVILDEKQGGLSVDVELLREPSDREKAALERAIEEARREVFGLLVEGRL